MKSALWRRLLATVVGAGFLFATAASAQIGDLPDREVEKCLLEGKVGKRIGKIYGVTRPVRLAIDCPRGPDSVVFKDLHDSRRGLQPKVGGFQEMSFSDSYRYERAAYLLDRQLGLNLVPVAVIRTVKGTTGALVAWIPNTTHENQMTQPPTGPQLAELAQRKAFMRLFDALILNVDRRQENWLVDKDTWELYLIDHSRAFRDRRQLSPEFNDQRARLTKAAYDRLTALEETALTELLGDLLSRLQIRALLARRDLIVEKIDRDCREFGHSAVFTDWHEEETAAPQPH